MNPTENDWKVDNLRYHASMKFNRSHFYKWKGESVGEYLEIGFDEKKLEREVRSHPRSL